MSNSGRAISNSILVENDEIMLVIASIALSNHINSEGTLVSPTPIHPHNHIVSTEFVWRPISPVRNAQRLDNVRPPTFR